MTASLAPVVAYLESGYRVTTWHGETIGIYRVISCWPTRFDNPYSTSRVAVRATIGGVAYHGQGYGVGMSIVLRPCRWQNGHGR